MSNPVYKRGNSVARLQNVWPIVNSPLHRLLIKLQANYSFFTEMHGAEAHKFLGMCKQEHYTGGESIPGQRESAGHFCMSVSSVVLIDIDGDDVARLRMDEISGSHEK